MWVVLMQLRYVVLALIIVAIILGAVVVSLYIQNTSTVCKGDGMVGNHTCTACGGTGLSKKENQNNL
jgi:hypothetical protein